MSAQPLPADLGYTAEHEWVRVDGDVLTVGITAYAADQLGDIVYVELPEAGRVLAESEAAGEIESTKSVGELFAPAAGEVVEVNQAVVDDPALINADAYAAWLVRLRVDTTPQLLDAEGYAALIGG